MRWTVILGLVWGCPSAPDDGAATADTSDVWVTEPPPAIEPTRACVAYLECLEAIESPELDLERRAFGPDGECWDTALAAVDCHNQCEASLPLERAASPTTLECWNGTVPDMGLLIDAIGQWFFVTDVRARDPNNPDCSPYGIVSPPSTEWPPGSGYQFVADDGAGAFRLSVQLSDPLLRDVSCVLTWNRRFVCDGARLRGLFAEDFLSASVEIVSGQTTRCEIDLVSERTRDL